MVEYIIRKPRQGRILVVVVIYKKYNIRWSCILIDEVYIKSNPNARIIKLVQLINNRMKGEIPWKILIIRTPFKSSP